MAAMQCTSSSMAAIVHSPLQCMTLYVCALHCMCRLACVHLFIAPDCVSSDD
jgi:hypothetical protein